MNPNSTYQDTDLREAIRRVEQRYSVPKPGTDFLQAVMQQVQATDTEPATQPARRRLWPWMVTGIGAAAAIIIAVFLLSPNPSSNLSTSPSSSLSTTSSSVKEGNEDLLAEATMEIPRGNTTPEGSNNPQIPSTHSASHTHRCPNPEQHPTTEPAKGSTVDLAMTATAAEQIITEEPAPSTTEVQVQELPPLSSEKQALANMYLAEVALQVAYKRQAQLQAVRAYTTSIIGQEEPAQPTIAF